MHTHDTTIPPASTRPRPRPRHHARTYGAALFAVGLLLLAAPPAAAHDQLLSSTPADGTTITTLPSEIVLTLSEAPLATGAQVVITATDGEMVATGAVSVDEATSTVTVPVTGQGPAGAYTVAWHVVSSDGHPIEGAFEFSLEPASTSNSEASPSPEAANASPGSSSTPTAQDLQEPTSPATQGPAGATDSHEDGGTSDPVVVVAGGIAIAVAILVVVTYATRRRDHDSEPADSASSSDAAE
ncbi:copper resistance protein CopC [Promicromonospora sp. NPDC023987]|uniref:copper resistance CopC family protein n=1 Tax=Promicromonospora sp. NPDC023987 TaxID=3155360 RepID=UPI00340EBA28